MKPSPTPLNPGWPSRQELLASLRVEVLEGAEEIQRAGQVLEQHHYLGKPHPVGERLWYAVCDAQDQWVAVLLFTAASRRLRHRDGWIGWSDEQRRRRLPLVVNNSRFLLLPGHNSPNLASAVLSRVTARLSADWMEGYEHPVLVVESFVDPQLFNGTLYTSAGWCELGTTQGNRRVSRDYYEAHERPKRLFVCELQRGARRSLQAEHLKSSLAAVEAKSRPRCTRAPGELRSLSELFKAQVPEYRRKHCTYPVQALLGIVAAAHLADAPRGQKDLEAFARSLSEGQLRALGVRYCVRRKGYPAPDQSTFSRMMAEVDLDIVEQVLIQWQEAIRGPAPAHEVVAMDGKQPKHSGGQNVVSAVSLPSLHYLGCELVAEKSNEIPAVRKLCARLDLDGRLVSLDALHTQRETARHLVLEAGADYLLTVKGNQCGIQQRIEQRVADPASPLLNSRITPEPAPDTAARKRKASG